MPLEWATKGVIVSQFDKDDIETLGLVKMDILGLRNLSAIEDALSAIKQHHGIDLDIDNIPLDDEPTYEMLRSCDTVGCFQVESPGMRGLLGRLQPRVFDDVIAQISLFRPGPMQADMINPFIARRHGEEEITYPHPSLEPILKETYGVILYQEQVISVSHALAGFTYGQSDSLRRAMTTDRSQEEMEKIKEAFIAGALGKGVEKEVAEEVFSKLQGVRGLWVLQGARGVVRQDRISDRISQDPLPRRVSDRHPQQRADGLLPAKRDHSRKRAGWALRIAAGGCQPERRASSQESKRSKQNGIRIGLNQVRTSARRRWSRL